MLDASHRFDRLPDAPGVGYKPQHFAEIIENSGAVEWLEIHAENYMGDGGRPLAQLRHLAERFAISVHGVGLSIGGEGQLDADHLARLKHLVGWLKPASFSEHLAWSPHATAFLREGAQRSGCGLLLDVNNVFVSATNLNTDPVSYIDAYPLELVGELHLGGHDEDQDDHGAPLLIDSHGREVADPVWSLYEYVIASGGARPTLIEWDNDVPAWPVLSAEANRAADILQKIAA